MYLVTATVASATASAAAPIAPLLGNLTFFNAGTVTAALSGNLSRLLQCNGFSECYNQWTCGSPRDYLYDTTRGSTPPTVASPPVGLRSAVPLGGIGAGTFELRADGSLADWMIEGQGTGLAANADQNSKLPLKNDAVLGLFTSASAADGSGPFAATLRTAPPAGLPGVDSLVYSGAYPFSRLRVVDARSPVNASLFAFSYFAPSSPANTSGSPFVVFSLLVTLSPTAPAPVNVSLLLSLPLSHSANTDRPLLDAHDPRNQTVATLPGTTAPGCRAACEASPTCVWWRHSGAGAPNITQVNHDCAGDDITTPARVAVTALADCVDHCLLRVPGCRGVVFDQIAGEQAGQCGNSNPTLFCCLPKTGCTDFAPKAGDTAWAAGSPADVCTLYSRAPAVEQYVVGTTAAPSGTDGGGGGGGVGDGGVSSGVKGSWGSQATASTRSLSMRRDNAYDADPAAAFQDPAAATASYTLLAADADAVSVGRGWWWSVCGWVGGCGRYVFLYGRCCEEGRRRRAIGDDSVKAYT